MKTRYISILFTVFLFFSHFGLAHTGLRSSSPANGEMLTESPASLKLDFDTSVRLMKVVLLSDKNKPVDIGFTPLVQPQKAFEITLPELPASGYTINWMAMGGDSHKISGQFKFHIHSAKNHNQHQH